MSLMHEWILLSIAFEWEAGRLALTFDTHPAGIVKLVAEGVVDLYVPQAKPWGPTVHVKGVRQLPARAKHRGKLEIEMQSGDIIKITAASFVFPAAAYGPVGSLEISAQGEC